MAQTPAKTCKGKMPLRPEKALYNQEIANMQMIPRTGALRPEKSTANQSNKVLNGTYVAKTCEGAAQNGTTKQITHP